MYSFQSLASGLLLLPNLLGSTYARPVKGGIVGTHSVAPQINPNLAAQISTNVAAILAASYLTGDQISQSLTNLNAISLSNQENTLGINSKISSSALDAVPLTNYEELVDEVTNGVISATALRTLNANNPSALDTSKTVGDLKNSINNGLLDSIKGALLWAFIESNPHADDTTIEESFENFDHAKIQDILDKMNQIFSDEGNTVRFSIYTTVDSLLSEWDEGELMTLFGEYINADVDQSKLGAPTDKLEAHEADIHSVGDAALSLEHELARGGTSGTDGHGHKL
ncbi:hypothetical protein MMC09_006728 [Bachmanniomyces sp. S44760]|nr:hypothetical protein [Bachmanniomyces sp. S44760]